MGKRLHHLPFKNSDHRIVSLYGRSITNTEDSRHFYLSNRQGLYPGYPALTTKKLILTESILDAASLMQQKAITETFAVLALYGTNGLTQEHQAAIAALPQLEEIIFILEDYAGDAGAIAALAQGALDLTQGMTGEVTPEQCENSLLKLGFVYGVGFLGDALGGPLGGLVLSAAAEKFLDAVEKSNAESYRLNIQNSTPLGYENADIGNGFHP